MKENNFKTIIYRGKGRNLDTLKDEYSKLIRRLEEVKSSGEILNAYGNCEIEDGDILYVIYMFITENFEIEKIGWMSAYVQIFSWQYQSFNEGAITYYTNFYEHTDYETILKTNSFLKSQGFDEISAIYSLPAHDYSIYSHDSEIPEEWIKAIEKVDEWMESNEGKVFQCLCDLCFANQ